MHFPFSTDCQNIRNTRLKFNIHILIPIFRIVVRLDFVRCKRILLTFYFSYFISYLALSSLHHFPIKWNCYGANICAHFVIDFYSFRISSNFQWENLTLYTYKGFFFLMRDLMNNDTQKTVSRTNTLLNKPFSRLDNLNFIFL